MWSPCPNIVDALSARKVGLESDVHGRWRLSSPELSLSVVSVNRVTATQRFPLIPEEPLTEPLTDVGQARKMAGSRAVSGGAES